MEIAMAPQPVVRKELIDKLKAGAGHGMIKSMEEEEDNFALAMLFALAELTAEYGFLLLGRERTIELCDEMRARVERVQRVTFAPRTN
jgi:hypothetical protein